jgi:hypothetical protein
VWQNGFFSSFSIVLNQRHDNLFFMLEKDDSERLDDFEHRLLFLELLCLVQGIAAKFYRGLLHETLHKIDPTLEPDTVGEQFHAHIDKEVEEWIRSTADDDMAKASILSSMYRDLKARNGGKL